MKERRVVLAPEAATDLEELYDWVAGEASPEAALRYLTPSPTLGLTP